MPTSNVANWLKCQPKFDRKTLGVYHLTSSTYLLPQHAEVKWIRRVVTCILFATLHPRVPQDTRGKCLKDLWNVTPRQFSIPKIILRVGVWIKRPLAFSSICVSWAWKWGQAYITPNVSNARYCLLHNSACVYVDTLCEFSNFEGRKNLGYLLQWSKHVKLHPFENRVFPRQTFCEPETLHSGTWDSHPYPPAVAKYPEFRNQLYEPEAF